MSNPNESAPFTSSNAPDAEEKKTAEAQNTPPPEHAQTSPDQKQHNPHQHTTPPPHQSYQRPRSNSYQANYRYTAGPNPQQHAGPQAYQPPFHQPSYGYPPDEEHRPYTPPEYAPPEHVYRKKPRSFLERFFYGEEPSHRRAHTPFRQRSIIDQLLERHWVWSVMGAVAAVLLIALILLCVSLRPLPPEEAADMKNASQPQAQEQQLPAPAPGDLGVYTYQQLQALMEENATGLENSYFVVITPEKDGQ